MAPITRTVPLDLIDPHPANPREDLGDLEGLAESIATIGILQAPGVESTGGERFTAAFGHRRIEAARLAGLTEIEVVVREDNDDDTYLALIAENEHQLPLSASDRAKGQQGLLALGDLDRAAKATGVSAELLAAARKGRTIVDKAKVQQATLEELAVIAEFEGKPELPELEKLIGSHSFTWRVDTLRREAKAAEKRAAVIAELEGMGATECTDYEFSTHVKVEDLLNQYDVPLIPAMCSTKQLMWRDHYGTIQAVITRAYADEAGFKSRYGAQTLTPEQAAERDARDKARAEFQAADEAAQDTRCAWLRKTIGLAVPPKVCGYIANLIANADSWNVELDAERILGEDPDPSTGMLYVWSSLVGWADTDAFAPIRDYENNTEDDLEPLRAWLGVLTALGYTLTPHEERLIAFEDAEPLTEEAPPHIAEAISGKDGYLFPVEVANLVSQARGGVNAHTHGKPRFDLALTDSEARLTVEGDTDDALLKATLMAIEDEADATFGTPETVGNLLVYVGAVE